MYIIVYIKKCQVNLCKNLTKSNNHQINNMSHSKGLHDVNRTNEVNISNKIMKKHSIFLWLFFAIVLVTLLASCGSRKVQRSETKETENTTIKTEAKTETKVTDNTKIVDTSVSDEFEIIPLSDTLPMIVNGITYKNAKIKHKKTKSNIVTAKSIIVDKNSVKSSNLTHNKNKVVKEKEIERKQSFLWLWLLLLLIPIYLLWRKYKSYLPF